MAHGYHITAPVSLRFAEGQSTTRLHNYAWRCPTTSNDTVLCHKERVMCFQYTHICLRQYVCLRPHPTTIFINKYNNTIISLILVCIWNTPITAWWCLITRVHLLLTTTFLSKNLLGLRWSLKRYGALVCNELYINTICLVIKYTLTHYLTQNPLFLMTY